MALASYLWSSGVLTLAPERVPVDPNDPEQRFTEALRRLKESQPSFWITECVVGPPTAWQLAGESLPGDTWEAAELRLDAVPRQPMLCPCCTPLDSPDAA
jgi:hypothetical protein